MGNFHEGAILLEAIFWGVILLGGGGGNSKGGNYLRGPNSGANFTGGKFHEGAILLGVLFWVLILLEFNFLGDNFTAG